MGVYTKEKNKTGSTSVHIVQKINGRQDYVKTVGYANDIVFYTVDGFHYFYRLPASQKEASIISVREEQQKTLLNAFDIIY